MAINAKAEANVHSSLKINLEDEIWYQIFGSTVDSLSIGGGQIEYLVSFDYEIVSANDALNPEFNAMINPGEMGWAEIFVRNGDKGRAELKVSIRDDKPDLFFVVCFRGGTEILIDNVDIRLIE